ncbi:MAG: diadenylate cyclase CdaA [Oscillospiraceae bacterium]|nr:diadenylate cyclase CdaA [Oscillospiraceae bacterium]
MDAILDFIRDIGAMIPTIKFMDIIDILLVAVLLYAGFYMIRTTAAARIAKGVVIIILLSILTDLLNMYLLNYLLDAVLEVGLLALLIMFQPELRRMLEKLGGKSFKEILLIKEQQREIDLVIQETVEACRVLSGDKTGALIVFERSVLLEEYQKNGTLVDAKITSQLLRNIFFTKAALHDGAVLIRDERLAAAGCVLPLTQNPDISPDLGTRHRAAIGISEASDAVVVVVSEETGTISVAVGGMLKRHLAPQTLEKLLHSELAPQEETKSRNPLKRLRNNTKEEDDTDAKA